MPLFMILSEVTIPNWALDSAKILLPVLFGLITGFLLEKFRNRTITFKYQTSIQPFGTSTEDDYWGNIEVYHNDALKKHLAFATIEIENGSNVDTEKVNIDVKVNENSQILGLSSYYKDTRTQILLEQEHYEYLSDVIIRNNSDLQAQKLNEGHVTPKSLLREVNFVMTNKKLHLPVFNRRSIMVTHLLLENFEGQIPIVQVSCLHRSVRLIKKEDQETERNREIMVSIATGFILFCFFIAFEIAQFPNATAPILYTGIAGALYGFLGLGIYKLLHYLYRSFM